MAWRLSTGLRNKMLGAESGEGSLREILANGQIRIYTGQQPGTADLGETGTLIATITLASGAMTSGVSTNGINIGYAADATIGKASGEVWSGVTVAEGIPGYFRWYPNNFDSHTGTATAGNKIRLDGACATSGAQMDISTASRAIGATITVDNVNLTLPSR